MSERNVDRLAAQLRRTAVEIKIKPDERIREGEMAGLLSVSCTPLREALNRLVSEGFFRVTGGQGFFCPSLTPEHILDLYQARAAIEYDAMRNAVACASEDQLAEFVAKLDAAEPLYHQTNNRLRLWIRMKRYTWRLYARIAIQSLCRCWPISRGASGMSE